MSDTRTAEEKYEERVWFQLGRLYPEMTRKEKRRKVREMRWGHFSNLHGKG